MAQNRKPPAYLEYAAAILANKQYRLMNLTERGLLYSIRLECWENKDVPASPIDLAKYLACEVSDVKEGLTERVKSFLYEKEGSLICPELDDYRQHLAERKAKQSRGGRDGAAITNAMKKKATKEANSTLLTTPQVTRQGDVESLVKSSTVHSNQIQSIEKGLVDDPFINEMIAYEKASNG